MTCVLAVTPFHSNRFGEGGVELQTKTCDNFDLGWFNSQCVVSGLSDGENCSSTCRMHAGTSACSLQSCQTKVSKTYNLSKTFEHDQLNVHEEDNWNTDYRATEKEKHNMILNYTQEPSGQSEMCNKTHVNTELQLATKSKGVKRKAEDTESDEVYIPPKRVSPFVNTPKERKDERKKVLKISVKKLKQLDDPETFLRRTVLVNNTMTRLQMELRDEKRRTKNRKYFSGYSAMYNICVSDSYLVDDPCLSGVHEKITDDMTDTLIKNVLHDTPNDVTKEVIHSVK